MSDEESFEILGSTPTPSLDMCNGSSPGSFIQRSMQPSNMSNGNSMNSSTNTMKNYSLMQVSGMATSMGPASVASLAHSSKVRGSTALEQSGLFPNPELAVGLILGKIDAETLKVAGLSIAFK